MKNYSRQRAAILEVLRSTDTHPTARWIYEQVRCKLPKISLGTVYRNLSELSAEGEILNLSVGDGFEHFDGDSSAHLHLYCRRCGEIADARISKNPLKDVAESMGFLPGQELYVMSGVCKKCLTADDFKN